MDPAGVGALLGCSLLVTCFVIIRICDIYEKKTLVSPNTFQILHKNHWKFHSLIVPLPSLSSTTRIFAASV